MTDMQEKIAAAGIRVKPLVWEDDGEWNTSKALVYFNCKYFIGELGAGRFFIEMSTPGCGSLIPNGLDQHTTREAAKVAAEAHHRELVLEMLEGSEE